MSSSVFPAPISAPPAAQQGPYYAYPFPGQPTHTPESGQNPPFVLFYFEKDHFWPIHPAKTHHVFTAFKDTMLEPIIDMTIHWRQDRAIRLQMDFQLDPNDRTVPAQMIDGKGYVAEEQGMTLLSSMASRPRHPASNGQNEEFFLNFQISPQ
ncbi:unnamed protein product [Caenorhabditis brenneri]